MSNAPQTGTPTTDPPADPPAPAGDPGQPSTPDSGRAFDDTYVAKLRQESAGYRNKLRDTEAQLAELRQAQMSDEERREARLTELATQNQALEAQVKAARLEAAVTAAAGRLDIVDPDAAVRLLDLTGVTYGDDGAPENIDTLLAGLLEARPYLRRPDPQPPVPQAGSPANPARPTPQGATLTRDDLARMTPEQVMAAEKGGQLDHLLGR